MNKLLFGVTAAAAFAASVPAAAQYGSQYGSQGAYGRGWDNLAQRIDELEDRLEDAIDAGVITRTEARSLRREIRQISRLEARYSFDGLSRPERDELQQRVRAIRQELRLADGRRDRYRDWDDNYGGGGGGSGGGYGRDDDDEDYREVSQVCFQPTGVQAIFGALLGSDNCLRVGDPVNMNLAAVPSEHRGRFRDGTRTYYRYLEGNVIEIDSRSRTVARIYEVD